LALAHELTDLLADALDVAEQRVRQRVEDRGLPGAGRPRDGEHVELGEIDLLLVPERRESLDVEPQRAHQIAPCTASSTSSNVRTSSSSASAPWTWRWYARNWSSGVRLASGADPGS